MYEGEQKYFQGFGNETEGKTPLETAMIRSYRTRLGGRGLDSSGSGY
jgi:hypothetical protein